MHRVQGAEQDMNYKTVMVSLALDGPNDACLAVAGDLAERFEARLVGIAASDIKPALYFAEGEYAQKILDEESKAIQRRLSELEAEFRATASKRTKSVEWRSALALPIPYVIQQSRAADILVVSARSEVLVDPYVAADASDLVMQAGRPLIVVPPAVQWLDLRSVLVAWKDAREARRAVLDALPILAAAKEVTVVEVLEENIDPAAALSHIEDVAGWLRCHGILANIVAPGADAVTPVAEQLDKMAANVGAGVVIAGAYGHSRFREWAFGGVTRHLAKKPSRCTFLSR